MQMKHQLVHLQRNHFHSPGLIMSTTIYKGFRLEVTEFQAALQIVNSFRPWVSQKAEELLDAFTANAQSSPVFKDQDPFTLWLDARKEFIEKKGRRVPALDTDFSVTLIPVDGAVLGIAYTEHQNWFEAWCKHPGVQDYAYWNNTDKPDDISDEEWEARSNAWEIMSSDPVSMQGFTIDLVSPQGPFPKVWRDM